jgi:hypothetical protein
MNNLDLEKTNVTVLVFDDKGTFFTRYKESVHTHPTRQTAEVADELRQKLRLTAYYHQGCTFVCDSDATGPVMVSRLFDVIDMAL